MGQGAPKAPKNDKEARQIFEKLDLQPWDSRGLIRAVLNRQAELAKRSDLRKVPVKDGFDKILDKKRKDAARGVNTAGFFAKEISKKAFVELCIDLIKEQRIPGSVADQEQELGEIYDTIDFDRSGGLDVSEIAAGLSVFLKGTSEEIVKAVFGAIDVDGNQTLDLEELQVYLRPFVKGMTPTNLPEEAAPLREYLVVRASQQIWRELAKEAGRSDLSCEVKDGKFQTKGGVKDEDMIKWVKKGHNIIDSLGRVVEKEIYMFWLSSSKRKTQWDVHKQERDAKEQRLQAQEAERRLQQTDLSSPCQPSLAAGGGCGAGGPPPTGGLGAAPPSQQPGWQQPQQGPPPQQAWPSQVQPQQEAADSGGWLSSWWSQPESQTQVPAPAVSSQALGPRSPDRHSQAHHWNIPPPPPPRGQPGQQSPGGQASAQSPVLSQAWSMPSAYSMNSQQSAHSVPSAAYFTPQSQQSPVLVSRQQSQQSAQSLQSQQRSRPGSLSSIAYVASSPPYDGGGFVASAGASPRYHAGER